MKRQISRALVHWSFSLLMLLMMNSLRSQPSFDLPINTLEMQFKDTLNDFAFDSLQHHLGKINPESANTRVTKYFQYLGEDGVCITKAWSSDPHFICMYPKEILIPGKIYSYTICFIHQGRKGPIDKSMGFRFSNETFVAIRFTGAYADVLKE